MEQLPEILNPFKVSHYNYSWSEIKLLINGLAERFENRYKISYHNDFHGKIILLASPSFKTYGVEKSYIIYLSKIDADVHTSLLTFEIKKYMGDIVIPSESRKAGEFLTEFCTDLLLSHQLN